MGPYRASAAILALILAMAGGAQADEMQQPATVANTPDWEAAAASLPGRGDATTADLFARLNALADPRFPGIAASTVPVLLPFDPATLTDPAKTAAQPGGFAPSKFFSAGPAGYHASFFIKASEVDGLPLRYARPVEVEMSGAAFVYTLDGPNIAESETTPQGFEGFPGLRRVLREAHLRYAFERFGVPYVVSIQCFNGRVTARRLSCKDADLVAARFLKTLNVAGGTPQPPQSTQPLDLTRPQTLSRSFTYHRPGSLIANSGYKTFGGRADYHVYARIRFPIALAPAYAKSQSFNPWGDCYMTGRVGRTSRKGAIYRCRRNNLPLVFDESAEQNFSYPWRDNFCEVRDTQVGQCPGGVGHQGQDLRPSDCVLKNPLADRCEPYQHDVVAAHDGIIHRNPPSYVVYETAFIVANTASENVRFRYMHMDPKHMDADGLVSGRRVRAGEVIGKVGNFYKKEGGTSYHLHFDTQVFTRDGWVWVNPYMTLVAAYERLIGARGKALEDEPIMTPPMAAPDDIIEQRASAKPRSATSKKAKSPKAKRHKAKRPSKKRHRRHR